MRRGAQPTATGTSTRDPNVARTGYAGQCRAMRRKGTRGARSPEMVLGGGRPMTARRRTKAAPSTATKSTCGRPAPIRPRSHGSRWVFEGTARPRPGCARGPRAVVATPRALPRRRFRMLVDDGRRSKTRCVAQISRSCADRVSSLAVRPRRNKIDDQRRACPRRTRSCECGHSRSSHWIRLDATRQKRRFGFPPRNGEDRGA